MCDELVSGTECKGCLCNSCDKYKSFGHFRLVEPLNSPRVSDKNIFNHNSCAICTKDVFKAFLTAPNDILRHPVTFVQKRCERHPLSSEQKASKSKYDRYEWEWDREGLLYSPLCYCIQNSIDSVACDKCRGLDDQISDILINGTEQTIEEIKERIDNIPEVERYFIEMNYPENGDKRVYLRYR